MGQLSQCSAHTDPTTDSGRCADSYSQPDAGTNGYSFARPNGHTPADCHACSHADTYPNAYGHTSPYTDSSTNGHSDT